VRQRHELGVKAIIAGNAPANPTVIRENPDAAMGNMGVDTFMITSTTKESVDFVTRWKKRFKGGEYPEPDCLSAKTYVGFQFLLEGIKKAGSVKVEKVIPALETLKIRSLNGDVYMRECDHQFMEPLPAVYVVSKTPPYFSVPVVIPISASMTDEKEVDNARCRRR